MQINEDTKILSLHLLLTQFLKYLGLKLFERSLHNSNVVPVIINDIYTLKFN